MKLKKLFATGLLSAVAVTTQAQSTVEVYGVVDTSVQSYNNGVDRYTRSVSNGLQTSILGFRGTEDLGGGLKVQFMLEGQLNPTEGSTGSNIVATNETFNREAWVGITGSLGHIRAGRTDVTAAQNVDFLTSQAWNLGFRPTNGTSVELGFDQKNVIRYISPAISGFTVEVGHASGNASGSTADAQASQTGASIMYNAGKLRLVAGYQKNDGASIAAKRDFVAYGASYNFGFASAGLSRATGDNSATGDVKSTSDIASVKIPLSNGYAVHGIYAQANDGTQASDGKGKGYSVAVTKSLSKRTTLYTAYTEIKNEANAKMAMYDMTAPTATGLDTKGLMAGISHSF